ncbi:MAG TPA: hypothetical protein PLO37_10350 [Candidatus Hydrogenedentes bacterium]|nr:hypothetical protein [Candidatus Hydrogenedentota bacterium]
MQSFSTEAQAHLARMRLQQDGIDATVHRFSRYRAIASGGFVLKVPVSDLKRAQFALKKLERPVDMDEYVSSDDESYVRCPKCSSVNIETAPLSLPLTVLAVVTFGIALLLIRRQRRCRKCGHSWQSRQVE